MQNAASLGEAVPGWSPRPLPPDEAIEGRYTRLEPLDSARHGDDLFAAQVGDTDRLWTYRFQGPFPDRAPFDAYLGDIANGADARFFAYIDKSTGKAGGLGSFMSMVPAMGSIEIGAIMIGSLMQRTREGTEALMLMARWAFAAGYRRLEWTCDPHNDASMKAAERLGFSFEAEFRGAYVTKGRNRDKSIWAIIDGDWPAIDAAYDAWLAKDNFEGGRQKSALSTLTAPLVHARSAVKPGEAKDTLGQPIGAAVADWTPPPWPPREPIEGRYCRVEPLDANNHAEALFEANRQDDDIWNYLPYGPFNTLDAYREWIAAEALGDDPLFHAIVDKATGKPAGVASYLRIAPSAGSIEAGHINYAKPLQRTRAGTEAMYFLMKRAFELGYRRYEWKCNALNAGSRSLAMRLGLSFEGVFRQAAVIKGRNRDTAWYGAIDAEWPVLQTAFETWLAPSNFDADGRQRTRLSDLTAPVLVARG